MAVYKIKKDTVEAVRVLEFSRDEEGWTEPGPATFSEFPQWLRDAVEAEAVQVFVPPPEHGPPRLLVADQCEDGLPVWLLPGDYVANSHAGVRPLKRETFEALYEGPA